MAARRRIGVMVPSTNTTCEADFQLVLPRSYTVHGQRLWLTNDALGEEGMLRMNGEIESGARYLATANVDAISYGCTTGSFFKGPGWDREMIDLIEHTAGVPAVATSPSVVEALRCFGAKRISVATPYPEWRSPAPRASTTRTRRWWWSSRHGRAGPMPTRCCAPARRGDRSKPSRRSSGGSASPSSARIRRASG